MDSRVAFVLNLDADLELARGRGYAPRASVREAMRAVVPHVAKTLLEPGDMLVDESTADDAARGFVGRSFCPTPRSIALLRRAGATPEPTPPLDVVASVNDRSWSASLGQTMPDACFVRDEAEALRRMARAPAMGSGWRVKRRHGMAGRGQRVVGVAPSDAQSAFVRAWVRDGGAQIEPNVVVLRELARHGFVSRDGILVMGNLTEQHVDATGAWVQSARIHEGPIEGCARALAQEVELVGERLHEAGYFGPFGVDAFVYEGIDGAPTLRVRSEVNARYSMGFAIGFDRKLTP